VPHRPAVESDFPAVVALTGQWRPNQRSRGSKGDADEEAYWRRMYAEHPDPAPFTAVLPTKEGHPNWGAPWCGSVVTGAGR
jgi:hypothetical protein